MLTSDTTSLFYWRDSAARKRASESAWRSLTQPASPAVGELGVVQKKARWVSTAVPAVWWAVLARGPGAPTANPGASAGLLPQQHPVSSTHSLPRWKVLCTSAMAQQLIGWLQGNNWRVNSLTSPNLMPNRHEMARCSWRIKVEMATWQWPGVFQESGCGTLTPGTTSDKHTKDMSGRWPKSWRQSRWVSGSALTVYTHRKPLACALGSSAMLFEIQLCQYARPG